MAELGFVRNESARQLRAGRSRTLAYVMLDAGNPFFTDVAAGIEEAAEESPASRSSCATAATAADREAGYLAHLDEQRVQGILVTPVDPEAAAPRRGRPPRHAGRRSSTAPATTSRFCSVAVDDVLGGRLAVEHLVDRGHRGSRSSAARSRSARSATASRAPAKAWSAAGCTDDRHRDRPTAATTVREGRLAGERLPGCPATAADGGVLRQRPARARPAPAAGGRQARVPSDLAIVGYDDIEFAAAAAVPLTSVRQPRQRARTPGRRAGPRRGGQPRAPAPAGGLPPRAGGPYLDAGLRTEHRFVSDPAGSPRGRGARRIGVYLAILSTAPIPGLSTVWFHSGRGAVRVVTCEYASSTSTSRRHRRAAAAAVLAAARGAGRQLAYELGSTTARPAGWSRRERARAWPGGARPRGERRRCRCGSGPIGARWSEPTAWRPGCWSRRTGASWVAPAEEAGPPGFRPAYLLRGEVDVDRPVVAARLYATAHGDLRDVLNGQRVGDTSWRPDSPSTPSRTQVQTYDVTDLLRPGAHTIEALLADGWYRGQVGLLRAARPVGRPTALLAQLHVEHPDGTTTVIGTGRTGDGRPRNRAADLIEGQPEDRRLSAGRARTGRRWSSVIAGSTPLVSRRRRRCGRWRRSGRWR